MSNVIDWSKYGRTRREKPQLEITWRENGRVIVDFSIEDLDQVFEYLRKQRDYWKSLPDGE